MTADRTKDILDAPDIAAAGEYFPAFAFYVSKQRLKKGQHISENVDIHSHSFKAAFLLKAFGMVADKQIQPEKNPGRIQLTDLAPHKVVDPLAQQPVLINLNFWKTAQGSKNVVSYAGEISGRPEFMQWPGRHCEKVADQIESGIGQD